MSKNERKEPEKPPEIEPKQVVKIREIAVHKRCPLCWGGLHGEGHQYGQHPKGAMTRIYFRCDMCGHTWTVDQIVEVVAVDHRLPDGIQAR